jgi:asparagine N-glycosylation enzyme membrane subunit Stt3
MADPGRERRPAWYAAAPGTWRDWVTILHLPYTAWHLSYVLIGAGLAPHLDGQRLAGTLVAFGLAVGLAAHALDELRGRPLATTIASPVLAGVAAVTLVCAAAIGAVGVTRIGWGLAAFIVAGVVLVVGYNLELWGGRMHTDAVFAAAWGAFPLVTAYYAQTGTVRPAALLAAVFAYGLSRAQRVLSREARLLRRRVASVTGVRVGLDGTRQVVSRTSLLQPLEQALVALSWASCCLGLALVLARSGH